MIINPWYNKFYLMWDAITKHRTDGALVRAELAMAPGRDVDEAYKELMDFIIQLFSGIKPNIYHTGMTFSEIS